MDHTFHGPRRKWLFTRHLPWFFLNLAAVPLCAAAWLRSRRPALGHAAVLLTVPLGYYLSYLVSSLSADHRYMYPSSLVVQVAFLAVLLSGLVGWLARHRWHRHPAGGAP